MGKFWTLGGLSVMELLRRTVRASWRDDVFGQGGRMAFYQFLAIFPSLLVAHSVVTRAPQLGGHLRGSLEALSAQVFPSRVLRLFEGMLGDFGARPRMGWRLISVSAAAVWAAHNGTWSMIYGLNRAYEVHEDRGWWRLTVTIVVLTACMAGTAAVALLLIFGGALLQGDGAGGLGVALEWIVLTGALGFTFGMLYRYAPNVRTQALRWCTPGAVCGLVLWLGATFATRLYFDHMNDYTTSYGPLSGVVMLLLWLYGCNGALLVGGEMNSAILKAKVGDGANETSTGT
jgi:membrane protein